MANDLTLDKNLNLTDLKNINSVLKFYGISASEMKIIDSSFYRAAQLKLCYQSKAMHASNTSILYKHPIYGLALYCRKTRSIFVETRKFELITSYLK